MIKGYTPGPGMPRCGCHAPRLFSGQLSSSAPCLSQRIWLPTTWAFLARSVHGLASPAGLFDSAVRHSGTSSGNLRAATALAARGGWGQPPLPPSTGRLGGLMGTPCCYQNVLVSLGTKVDLDSCSKDVTRTQIRVRSTWSITSQLFHDFSLTFLSRMLETIWCLFDQRPDQA